MLRQISVKLEPELLEALKRYAAEHNTTMNETVRRALRLYFDIFCHRIDTSETYRTRRITIRGPYKLVSSRG